MKCEMNGCTREAAFDVEVMLGSSLKMCRQCAAMRTICGKNELASDFVSVRPLPATYEASVGLTMAEYAGVAWPAARRD